MLDTPPVKRLLGWVVVTVALVFSSAPCALQFGLRKFDCLVKRDVEALLARATTTAGGAVVTEEMLQGLPMPVRRYLRHTGIIGKSFVCTVRHEQEGTPHPLPHTEEPSLRAWASNSQKPSLTSQSPAPSCSRNPTTL